MTAYDWLLFFHVAAAFAMAAAMIAFWAIVIATRDGDHPAARTLSRPAAILVGTGSLLTLVLGISLAVDSDDYELWDAWIIASLLLWAIGVGAGQRSGALFARVGATGDVALKQRAFLLHVTATVALLLVLVLMIFKPGA